MAEARVYHLGAAVRIQMRFNLARVEHYGGPCRIVLRNTREPLHNEWIAGSTAEIPIERVLYSRSRTEKGDTRSRHCQPSRSSALHGECIQNQHRHTLVGALSLSAAKRGYADRRKIEFALG